MDPHCFLLKIVDVRDLADEVLGVWPKLVIDQGRKGVEVQRDVDTAFLRVAVAVPGSHPVYAALHGQDAEDHPNSLLVPKVMKFLRDFCAETDATLARALLAKLPPGRSVGWHVDRGSYYQATVRYHLAILNEGARSGWRRPPTSSIRGSSGASTTPNRTARSTIPRRTEST